MINKLVIGGWDSIYKNVYALDNNNRVVYHIIHDSNYPNNYEIISDSDVNWSYSDYNNSIQVLNDRKQSFFEFENIHEISDQDLKNHNENIYNLIKKEEAINNILDQL